MDKDKMRAAIEAVLYVYGEALSVDELARALDEPQILVYEVLSEMEKDMRSRQSGIRLVFTEDKVQFATNEDYNEYVEKLLGAERKPRALSQAAIETLAVIAYNQPATKADIEAVRGVKCDYSINSLLSKGLICVSGRKETIGKPLLYSTTDEFLRHFGLASLHGLPSVNDDAQQGGETEPT